MEKRWLVLSEGKDLEKSLLENRKIQDSQTFFEPHLCKLSSPNKIFPNLDKALERIKKAIKNQELIFIYGDFDVDGVTGTAILWETIDFLGGKVMPYIPNREKEGYGINTDALVSLAREGAKLIISVDCGVTAVEEAKIAKELDVDLIITDHHPKQEVKPKAFALLHSDKLSGSGVAFMLAEALLDSFKKDTDEQVFKNLELATIGTIADMTPLVEDSRIIVSNGLHNLENTGRIGLRAIYEEANLTKKIGTYEVGFIIAPRLNAAGRMETALDSLRLLLTRNKERARLLAAKISETNRRRQEALKIALEHARKFLRSTPVPKIIIAHHKSYPSGVIGLVAGKLVEEFSRPAIVISEGNISKGSARSMNDFDISDAIASAKKYLESHGGHAKAAGFSLKSNNISKFKDKILDFAESNLKDKDFIPVIKVDAILEDHFLNNQILELTGKFKPFGVGNPEPLFLTKNLGVVDTRLVGNEGKHLRLVLSGKNKLIFEAIGFGLGKKNLKKGQKIDIVHAVNENNWNGGKKLELKIKDFKTAKC